ncbi:MAG: GNAT family N-acetyltransferase [Candidatus Nanopelagicales bacterium]
MTRITEVTRLAEIDAAQHLMDGPMKAAAANKFLEESNHHLLLAYSDTDELLPVGMVSGVETTHPDKGTEMFLYELSVDESSRRQGVGAALVKALAKLGKERGCYGMWVLTDSDNDAALATYRSGGGEGPTSHVMIAWTFTP